MLLHVLLMWKVPSHNLCSSCQIHEWFAYQWLNYYWPKSHKVLSIWALSMNSLDTHKILVQRAHTTNTDFGKCRRKCSSQMGMEIKLIVGNLRTVVVKEWTCTPKNSLAKNLFQNLHVFLLQDHNKIATNLKKQTHKIA